MVFGKEFLPDAEIQPKAISETEIPTPTAEPEQENTQEAVTNISEQEIPAVTELETTTESVVSEQIILDYFKSQGKEIHSLEDLFKEKEVIKEVVKEVNPYEGLLSEEDEQYFKYRKETGRTREDFNALNKDYDKTDALELARERIRKESGQNITDAQADAFLERKLNIDLTDLAEIDPLDRIELATFSNPYREEKKAEQQKYKQPIEKKTESEQPAEQDEIIQLDNGTLMKKADYQLLVENRQKYIEEATTNVNSVTGVAFAIEVDDNGTKRELQYGYDFSPEDKHSMLSIVGDVNGTMEKRYRSETGFNHKQFAEDMFWSDPKNREKAIHSIVHKARAEAIEEIIKNENNVNFSRNSLSTGNDKKIVPVTEKKGSYGFPQNFKP